MWSLAAVAALALAAPSPAATRGDVWFLRAGESVPVGRSAPGIPGLVRSLLAGPTRRERAGGFGTAIPAGTLLRELPKGPSEPRAEGYLEALLWTRENVLRHSVCDGLLEDVFRGPALDAVARRDPRVT